LNILDFILIIIVIIGFILGFKDGFVRKLIGLIGFVLAVFLAVYFASEFGKIIESSLDIEIYLAEIIAGTSIFLMVILIFAIIKRWIHPFDKVNNLINQLLGGFVGTIQIIFFLSAVLFLLNIFNVPDKSTKSSSLLYEKIYKVIPYTIDYLNRFTPDTKEKVKEYIKDKDSI